MLHLKIRKKEQQTNTVSQKLSGLLPGIINLDLEGSFKWNVGTGFEDACQATLYDYLLSSTSLW